MRTRKHGSHALAALALTASFATVARPRDAGAFCGFYVAGSADQLLNNATQVALMRNGVRTVLTMSNNYQGPPADFAMVVPVPVVLHQENVRTLPHNVFEHLEQLTSPRLVEYWEQDPCAPPPPQIAFGAVASMRRTGSAPGGGAGADLGVRIEAQFAVGEYQILILSARDSSGLETWLTRNRYNIPSGAAEMLAPYIRDQWKFFVARVDIEQVQRRPDGTARLSPLRFHYDSPEFRLPVRLGLLNAPERQDLIVYTLSPTTRYELANYTNAFIPTNLDVADGVRGQFPAFYAALFDRALEVAGGRAVITEYAWSTSSCDPCPGPPMNPSELTTLGVDVAGAGVSPYNLVVTRLHTRYNRATLTEDLVFREAAPAMGGREVHGTDGRVETGARVGPGAVGSNNFQARYAIRHPWTGPVACASPRRGVWGGPPAGTAASGTQTARDLATAPRGAVQLASLVVSNNAGIDLGQRATTGGSATPSTPATGTPGTPPSTPATPPSVPSTPSTPSAPSTPSTPSAPSTPRSTSSGRCSVRDVGAGPARGGLIALSVVAMARAARRRRR